MGRPPEPVPQDVADALVTWLAEGGTLRSFCRQPGRPARRTVDEWRAKDKVFAALVARARDDGFEVLAEEALAISDEPQEGETVTTDDTGVKTVRADMLGHRKLRVETRLKLLACWDPRRYGNKVAIGGDPNGLPIRISDVERAAKIKSILAAAQERLEDRADADA